MAGRVGTLLTDPGASLTAGTPPTTGGLTATANAGASSATSWTILLRPAGDVSRRSTSRRSHGSPRAARELVCSFDASTSSDLEDSIESYAWDFGDGDDR